MNLKYIDGMNGHDFEHFCAELLRKNGFQDVSVTPGSGDQGVDVLAKKDGIKYAIQCKNYASPLSNTPIQEVAAGRQFYGCHVGVVLTNSTFTNGAIQLADATNVLLWDRAKLEELIVAAGGLEAFGFNLQNEPTKEESDQLLAQQEEVVRKIQGLFNSYINEITDKLSDCLEEACACLEQPETVAYGLRNLSCHFLESGNNVIEYIRSVQNNLSKLYELLNANGNTWSNSNEAVSEITNISKINNQIIIKLSSFKLTVAMMRRPDGVPRFGQKAAELKESKKELKTAINFYIDSLKKVNSIMAEINQEHIEYKAVENKRNK